METTVPEGSMGLTKKCNKGKIVNIMNKNKKWFGKYI